MSNSANTTPPARTWRDIEQAIAPRAMSSEGRKRLMWGAARTVCVLFCIGLAGWGAYEVWATWQSNPTKIKAPVKSAPVRTIMLRTDGVLDHAWTVRTLELPKNAGLMELDLFVLQTRLLASGQVRMAVITRKFPDTLNVMIEERSPVARVMAQIGSEAPQGFLVARDGVIFAGVGYDAAMVGTLPYLDGVVLKRSNGRFQPIQGMEVVADLLSTAHANIPALYSGWQTVSLARLATDGEIVVRSRDIAEITFGLRDDFFRQVAQLDMIAEEARLQPDRPPLRSVNLAVGGMQVPVAFESPEPLPASPSSAPASRSVKPANSPAPTQAPRLPPQRPALFTNLYFPSREF